MLCFYVYVFFLFLLHIYINLFQVSDDPYPMWNEKKNVCLTSDEGHHRPEINL